MADHIFMNSRIDKSCYAGDLDVKKEISAFGLSIKRLKSALPYQMVTVWASVSLEWELEQTWAWRNSESSSKRSRRAELLTGTEGQKRI